MKDFALRDDIRQLTDTDPRIRPGRRKFVYSCLLHSLSLQHARKTLEALARNPDCREWFK